MNTHSAVETSRKHYPRTHVEFHKDKQIVRSLNFPEVLPNVIVGQQIAFDHTSTSMCLHGRVNRVSHVVFLGEEPPVTYIDVELDDD